MTPEVNLHDGQWNAVLTLSYNIEYFPIEKREIVISIFPLESLEAVTGDLTNDSITVASQQQPYPASVKGATDA